MPNDRETPLLDEIPEDLRPQVEGRLEAGEGVELSIASDIKLDGHYGDAWLLATDRRLLALSPNGEGDPHVEEIALAEITTVEIRELSGSGVIKVRTGDRGRTMAVFSKSAIARFSDVPAQLEALIAKARPLVEGEKIIDGRIGSGLDKGTRCEKCGRVIPHRIGICPACLDPGKLLFRLISRALPYRGLVAISLLLMLVATFVSLSPPLLMGTLIDHVLAPVVAASASSTDSSSDATSLLLDLIPGAPSGVPSAEDRSYLLAVLVGLLLLVHVSQNALGAVRSYMMAMIGQRVTLDLRNQVYRQLHRLSLSFYNERETGRIMASVTQDVGRLQDFISDGLQEVIRDILTLLIICGILVYLNAGLAALVLIPTPFLVWATLNFGKRLHSTYRGLWRRWAGLSALIGDVVPGVRVVKAFAQEKREVARFEARSTGLLSGELRVARIRSVFTPIMAFLTSLGTLIIWWVGGGKVLGGSMSLGDFVAFTGFMWRFYGPVESLCRLNHRFQRAATSAERVFEVIDTQPDVDDHSQATIMPPIEGRVEFSNVNFAYEPGTPILQDVSFVVEPGEMIGLAGHSGAGKSTLINLICRFYDIQEGTITIDGHDIRDVTLKSLRDQIGIVLQEPFLFNGPIGDNIAYGHPAASLDEIVSAAKAANCHDFVMGQPDAYDTVVGERGVRMSAGERQRISIARAILRNPRILILDEATASVDTETEAAIQQALSRLIKGRTTFAIAHRLSTLKNSNRLLILAKGELEEMGTHEELIERDGIYANLCQMQTEMSKIRAW
jgi:ATP-binding cassette subfamily B protein